VLTKDRSRTALIAVAVAAAALVGCGDDDDGATSTSTTGASSPTTGAGPDLDGVVDIGGRGLYVRCSGSGSPTVFLEGGDEDTSASYAFAEERLSETTRTCVYDRANLGRSDPDPGPRGLPDLVDDMEALLDAASIPGPYVLVGTSGGGYIPVGFAVAHPEDVAGMVFVEVPSPFLDPPPDILEITAWDHPTNIEQRDYLQIERDAWDARTRIGDIPVTIISNDYGPEALAGERTNVEDQKGWLVLSPRAKQVVVTTGHAVEEEDPDLVIDAILEVVEAARQR